MGERGPKVRKPEHVKLPSGIYLRGKIYWITYGNGSGRTIRESTYGSDLKKAKDLLTLRKAAVLQGKLPEIYSESKSRTFYSLVEDYEERVSKKKRSYSTEKTMLPILKDAVGNLPLRRIGKNTVIAVQEYLLKERKIVEATVNRYVAIFKNMMTHAHDEKWINGAVLEDVRRAKMFPEVVKNVVPLSPNECVELIKLCPPRIRIAIIICIYTGLRRKDVLKMRWEDINFDLGEIVVHVSKTANTATEILHIQMSDTLRYFLENTPRESEYVVCKDDGKPFKTFKDSWQNIREAIGKPKLRLPDLRHTFASLLVQNGTALYAIATMLGHTTMQMSKRYSHLLPEHHSREAKKLDSIIPLQVDEFFGPRHIYVKDAELAEKKEQ